MTHLIKKLSYPSINHFLWMEIQPIHLKYIIFYLFKKKILLDKVLYLYTFLNPNIVEFSTHSLKTMLNQWTLDYLTQWITKICWIVHYPSNNINSKTNSHLKREVCRIEHCGWSCYQPLLDHPQMSISIYFTLEMFNPWCDGVLEIIHWLVMWPKWYI